MTVSRKFYTKCFPQISALHSYQGRTQGGGDGVLEHPSAEVQSTFSLNVILKMIATSGFLTALECTKFVFGRGSAPDPLAGLRGPTFKERGGKEMGRGGRKGRENGRG